MSSTPRDWATGNRVTASALNIEIRDRLLQLSTPKPWQTVPVLYAYDDTSGSISPTDAATGSGIDTGSQSLYWEVGDLVYWQALWVGYWNHAGHAAVGVQTHVMGFTLPFMPSTEGRAIGQGSGWRSMWEATAPTEQVFSLIYAAGGEWSKSPSAPTEGIASIDDIWTRHGGALMTGYGKGTPAWSEEWPSSVTTRCSLRASGLYLKEPGAPKPPESWEY